MHKNRKEFADWIGKIPRRSPSFPQVALVLDVIGVASVFAGAVIPSWQLVLFGLACSITAQAIRY